MQTIDFEPLVYIAKTYDAITGDRIHAAVYSVIEL
jgi:hypothetical protein